MLRHRRVILQGLVLVALHRDFPLERDDLDVARHVLEVDGQRVLIPEPNIPFGSGEVAALAVLRLPEEDLCLRLRRSLLDYRRKGEKGFVLDTRLPVAYFCLQLVVTEQRLLEQLVRDSLHR